MKEIEILVTTVSGSQELESSCRKMNNEFYKIGDVNIEDSGDCYLINGKYRKVKTKFIIFDHRLGRYVLKGDFKENTFFTEEGVVKINNEELVIGAFSYSNPNELVYINTNDGKRLAVIDESILKDSFFYKEYITNGEYYHRQSLNCIDFNKIQSCDNNYKNSLHYDSRGIMDNYISSHEMMYKFPENHKFLKDAKVNLTKDFTFGLEFETSKGVIPERICKKMGLLPLRDGSIDGLEYVTIPLKHNIGVSSILSVLDQLNYRTEHNESCSLHIHIGNVPRTEKFFIAFYKLLFMLQDEFFDMYPLYKKQNLNVKRKHYTKPFPYRETIMLMDREVNDNNIKRNFNVLYKYLSMGYDYDSVGNDLSNVKSHPSDPGGSSKWNIKTRYHFINLIPLLFGNKETVEFRIHTPTTDDNKVINYLLLCCAIVDYAIKNESKILSSSLTLLNVDLRAVVISYFNSLYTQSGGDNMISKMKEEVINYLYIRKNYIYEKLQRGDIICKEDDLIYNSSNFNWKNLESKNNIFKSHKPNWIPMSDSIPGVYTQFAGTSIGLNNIVDPEPVPTPVNNESEENNEYYDEDED